jgi:NAD-dependent deacetylase
MDVASPEGWMRDPAMVLDFYNQRRKLLHTVGPNPGHLALKKLEQKHDVSIVTQNIDNLHEKAGSTNIIHLHGELLKARSSMDPNLKYDWPGDISVGDSCELGSQLRPDVVWFGEVVPALEDAAQLVSQADMVMIVGTSMLVYPAAGLVMYVSPNCKVFYIDPKPNVNHEMRRMKNLSIIADKAGMALPPLVEQILTDEYP